MINAVKEHGPYLWLGLGGLLQRRDLPPNLDEGLIVHPENLVLNGETFVPSTRVDHGDFGTLDDVQCLHDERTIALRRPKQSHQQQEIPGEREVSRRTTQLAQLQHCWSTRDV